MLVDCNLKDEAAARPPRQAAGAFSIAGRVVNNIACSSRRTDRGITAEQLRNTFETNVSATSLLPRRRSNTCGGRRHHQHCDGRRLRGERAADRLRRARARCLVQPLAGAVAGRRGIRVNAVAPGPYGRRNPVQLLLRRVAQFGKDTPLGRAAQPFELRPPTSTWPQRTPLRHGQVVHVTVAGSRILGFSSVGRPAPNQNDRKGPARCGPLRHDLLIC
jgi:NAD(P)-dependent dehydrogenase (short-subunit alcohol dehydrogenase family)